MGWASVGWSCVSKVDTFYWGAVKHLALYWAMMLELKVLNWYTDGARGVPKMSGMLGIQSSRVVIMYP